MAWNQILHKYFRVKGGLTKIYPKIRDAVLLAWVLLLPILILAVALGLVEDPRSMDIISGVFLSWIVGAVIAFVVMLVRFVWNFARARVERVPGGRQG